MSNFKTTEGYYNKLRGRFKLNCTVPDLSSIKRGLEFQKNNITHIFFPSRSNGAVVLLILKHLDSDRRDVSNFPEKQYGLRIEEPFDTSLAPSSFNEIIPVIVIHEEDYDFTNSFYKNKIAKYIAHNFQPTIIKFEMGMEIIYLGYNSQDFDDFMSQEFPKTIQASTDNEKPEGIEKDESINEQPRTTTHGGVLKPGTI